MDTETASAEPTVMQSQLQGRCAGIGTETSYQHNLECARTAILRSFFKLANLPPENWRDLADVVDDHLHVAWAAGYVAGASQR